MDRTDVLVPYGTYPINNADSMLDVRGATAFRIHLSVGKPWKPKNAIRLRIQMLMPDDSGTVADHWEIVAEKDFMGPGEYDLAASKIGWHAVTEVFNQLDEATYGADAITSLPDAPAP